MSPRDVGPALRKSAALRALCMRLPHIPTPAEERLLVRFDLLAQLPDSTTDADIEVLVAGWRRWWREGQIERLLAMAWSLPRRLLELDRRLSSWAHAARVRRWTELQDDIERCRTCIDQRPTEVALPLRRGEIPAPPAEIRVLFVGVAPTRLAGKSRGMHFYSNRTDLLRTALFRALDRPPFRMALTAANERSKNEADCMFHRAGFFFVHAAKIRPTTCDAPPTAILTFCAKQHFQAEIELLRPHAICFLGNTRGHQPAVARALFGRRLGNVPERATTGSWTGLAAVAAQPRRRGVPRAAGSLRALWEVLEGSGIQQTTESPAAMVRG